MEAFGIAGKEFLKSTLANCTDPAKAITDFQSENGIQLESLECALPLLDLHNVRRLEFHQNVLERLRDMLSKKVEQMSKSGQSSDTRKLQKLLDTSFPAIYIPLLRPVILHLMRHVPEVKGEYLDRIRENTDIYNDCHVEVKRQIWLKEQSLFGEEVSPLLTQYIRDKEHLLFSHDTGVSNSFFMLTPVQRRHSHIVQRLVTMIGENIHLYEIVLHFIRTLFIRTRNVHYCTLRTELLMAFHDANNKTICSVDPCHGFDWCLDACMREKVIDDKRRRELVGLLDNVGHSSEEVLGDLSIIMCDPYVINFLSLYTVRILQHCVHQEQLPRNNDLLLLLLRMLNLGLCAWDMHERQEFKEPEMDNKVIIKFLPGVMYMMVEEQQLKLSLQSPEEQATSSIPGIYMEYIMENNIACQLGLYYTIHIVRHKDRANLMRIVPTLTSCDNDRALDDTFLHAFITLLIPMADDFKQEDFCDIIFDKFLLMSVSRENVVRHILRLLWFTHHKLPPAKLASLMSIIEKISSNESIQEICAKLQEKMTTVAPSEGVAEEGDGGVVEGEPAQGVAPAVPGLLSTPASSGPVPATPYPHGGLF